MERLSGELGSVAMVAPMLSREYDAACTSGLLDLLFRFEPPACDLERSPHGSGADFADTAQLMRGSGKSMHVGVLDLGIHASIDANPQRCALMSAFKEHRECLAWASKSALPRPWDQLSAVTCRLRLRPAAASELMKSFEPIADAFQ